MSKNDQNGRFPGTEGLTYYTVPELEAFSGLGHGFSARVADPGPLDQAGGQMLFLKQVHGNRIIPVAQAGGRLLPEGIDRDRRIEGDGMITSVPGLCLGIRVADCLPVVFLAPGKKVVGIAHAGWRGTRLRIVEKLLAAGRNLYSLRPGDFWVGMGPAIGPCCYQVGPEIEEAFQLDFSHSSEYIFRAADGSLRLDLREANRLQLLAAGVPDVQIFNLSLCTFCRADLFSSARREGRGCGRQIAWVGIGKQVLQ